MPRPNRPPPRTLTVVAKQEITPNLLRVTLGGADMADFPAGQAGAYVKLRLPDADNPNKTLVRTYTIRNQRSDEIDVDFALHGQTSTGSAGPATEWALTAQIEDHILIAGPGPAKPLVQSARQYLIVGDMTSLPAIAVHLEQLDAASQGTVIIEIMDNQDTQDLARPEGIDVQWVVNSQPGVGAAKLTDQVRKTKLLDGVYVWCACEFSAMKMLRAYFREECGLTTNSIYISSYWKSGLNEDAHKQIKREDAQIQS